MVDPSRWMNSITVSKVYLVHNGIGGDLFELCEDKISAIALRDFHEKDPSQNEIHIEVRDVRSVRSGRGTPPERKPDVSEESWHKKRFGW